MANCVFWLGVSREGGHYFVSFCIIFCIIG